jgi:uncharacterized Ntn-hydrolase superfamily protein
MMSRTLAAALAGLLAFLVAGPAIGDSGVPHVATFSIVAADTVEHEWGVAVASRFLAVGSVVPWARAGVGAIATQAAVNTAFGSYGLDLLERGETADNVLDRLLRTDPRPEARQVAIVDRSGHVAFHTGKECEPWAGGVPGAGFVVIGNDLADSGVLDAMAKAFGGAEGSLAERLLVALDAGEEAGGDARGRQAAALLVVKGGGGYLGGNDRLVDLRVDDHPTPVKELERLYKLHAAYFLPSVYMRLGDQATAAGYKAAAERQYGRVVELYRKGIAAFPSDAKLMNGLAWFYVKHRINLDEAFRWAEKAHEIEPRSWQVVDTLAEIHYARGNILQAHQLAMQALALDPQNPYLRTQVARFQDLVDKGGR